MELAAARSVAASEGDLDERDERARPAPGKVTRTAQVPASARSIALRLHRSLDALDAMVDREVAAGLAGEAQASTGRPLPASLRTRLEQRLGVGLEDVRLHTGAASAAAAAALHARAYTVGHDIHFAAGRYDADSAAGQHLIAHEVAHAAWHRGGPVDAGELSVSAPGDAHEHEAETFAGSFVDSLLHGHTPGLTPRPAAGGSAAIHRDAEDDAADAIFGRVGPDRAALVSELAALLDPHTTQVRNEGVNRGEMMETSVGPRWDSHGGSVRRHTVGFVTAFRVLRRLQRGFLPAAQEVASRVIDRVGRARLTQLADSADGRQVVTLLHELAATPGNAPALEVEAAVRESDRALGPALGGSTALVDRVRRLVMLPMTFSWNALGESDTLDDVAAEVEALGDDAGLAQVPSHLQSAYLRCAQTVARALQDREAERQRFRDRQARVPEVALAEARPSVREQARAIAGMGPIGSIAMLVQFGRGADAESAIAAGQAAEAFFLLAVPTARALGAGRPPVMLPVGRAPAAPVAPPASVPATAAPPAEAPSPSTPARTPETQPVPPPNNAAATPEVAPRRPGSAPAEAPAEVTVGAGGGTARGPTPPERPGLETAGHRANRQAAIDEVYQRAAQQLPEARQEYAAARTASTALEARRVAVSAQLRAAGISLERAHALERGAPPTAAESTEAAQALRSQWQEVLGEIATGTPHENRARERVDRLENPRTAAQVLADLREQTPGHGPVAEALRDAPRDVFGLPPQRAPGSPGGPGAAPPRLSVEHVRPVSVIVLMRGFVDIRSRQAQLEILDLAENLVSLNGFINSRRGNRSWSAVTETDLADVITPANRARIQQGLETLRAREASVEAVIQARIDRALARQGAN